MAEEIQEDLLKPFLLGTLELSNRFVFPPVKLGYGNPDGTLTDRQVRFYGRIAQEGPAVIILEPVSVTPDGKEHPRQLCVHLPESVAQLKKIADAVHQENRLACLHLNHAGAAANPKVIGAKPKAPGVITCPSHGQESQPLTLQGIQEIVAGFKTAAQKAVRAGFDLIEVQAGHGYLLSQFLNAKTNHRKDPYGQDRLRFAKDVLSAVKEEAQSKPIVVRISGNEMSPEFGISGADLLPFLKWAEDQGIAASHVGMGHACFSPPWYFHHGSLPLKPQADALSWLRKQASLPLITPGSCFLPLPGFMRIPANWKGSSFSG